MKEDLVNLVDLDKIDVKIYTLKCEKNGFPAEIQALKDEEEDLKGTLNTHKEQYNRLEMDRKELELQVDANKAQILKNDGQLAMIKKNDEYKAMLHQMEELKHKNDLIEEDILIKMEEIEDVQKAISEEEVKLKGETDELKKREAEVNQAVANIDQDIASMTEQRARLLAGLSAKVSQTYTQILNKRQDRAIAQILDESTCGACHMVLQAHVVDSAKGGIEIVLCDTCSRMLYHPDLLAQLKTASTDIL